MKVLLDIKDDKVAFIMELLKNFKFVKANSLTPGESVILQEIREAVEEVNEVKAGKKKSRPFDEFLEEL